MNMSKEKLMRLAGRALKRTESYQWNRGLDVPDEENYKIDYLLVKGSKASPEDVIAYASFEDDMVRFHPLRENDQPFAHYGECFRWQCLFALYRRWRRRRKRRDNADRCD